jgi:NAD+ synthase (glutamine-hydrolysing)
MNISMAQLDPTVGDIEGNLARIKAVLEAETERGADLVVFSELFLTGYPPLDLLERPSFIGETRLAVKDLVRFTAKVPGPGVVFGAPLPADRTAGKPLYNSALLVHEGRVAFIQHKTLLPTYDVFDELRYFRPAEEIRTFPFKGEVLGLSICEDAWNDPELWPGANLYTVDPIEVLAGQGATLQVNISASPFDVSKEAVRFHLMGHHARRHGRPLVMVNQVGGNDELIFDGRSLAFDGLGRPAAACPPFVEHVHRFDSRAGGDPGLYIPLDRVQAVHDALVLGIRDYMRKCGFERAVIGLSGGIDSALTASLAAEAVGGKNVLGITMPSPFSSPGSIEDSRILAARLGIGFEVIPITAIQEAYLRELGPHFQGRPADTTEENIQARIRGNILMAFSNKFGALVLSTGNKSELAVGYCTLYGDMSGGLAAISDVPKTMVYDLARYVNRSAEIIPQAILDKPPSAELKAGQLDSDSLPPYPVLDGILHHFVEERLALPDIVAKGYDRETVERVVGLVERNEYKRKQAPPGLKVTTKAFGAGRRMPIAAGRGR